MFLIFGCCTVPVTVFNVQVLVTRTVAQTKITRTMTAANGGPPAPAQQQTAATPPPPVSSPSSQATPPPSSRGYRPNPKSVASPIALAPSSGIPYGHVPAYLPGSASLVEELDQRIMLVLRDGRHLVGVRFIIQEKGLQKLDEHKDVDVNLMERGKTKGLDEEMKT
jgi:hypothetical protein